MVHGDTDETVTIETDRLMTAAGVWDATAAIVVQIAHHHGWPAFAADPGRLHRIDRELDIQPVTCPQSRTTPSPPMPSMGQDEKHHHRRRRRPTTPGAVHYPCRHEQYRWPRLRAARARRGWAHEAVAEAAAGQTVYLTRDGQPFAAVVPPGMADRRAAADAALARIVAVAGAPTLADYQRVFTQLGRPWPGDDQIRRTYPVSA